MNLEKSLAFAEVHHQHLKHYARNLIEANTAVIVWHWKMNFYRRMPINIFESIAKVYSALTGKFQRTWQHPTTWVHLWIYLLEEVEALVRKLTFKNTELVVADKHVPITTTRTKRAFPPMYFSFPFLCHLGSISGIPADNITLLLLIALFLLHSLNLWQLVIQMRNQHENCS